MNERAPHGTICRRKLPTLLFWSSTRVADEALADFERQLTSVWSGREAVTSYSMAIPHLGSDGFDIDIFVEPSRIDASFGGLHATFHSVAETFVWVRRALSPHYQLRITVAGKLPSRWRLEPVDSQNAPGAVLEAGVVGLLSQFRTQHVIVRHNALLEPILKPAAAPSKPVASVYPAPRLILVRNSHADLPHHLADRRSIITQPSLPLE